MGLTPIATLILGAVVALGDRQSPPSSPPPPVSDVRPFPHLTVFDAMCRFREVYCKRSDWLSFLRTQHLTELTAPAGGRAYRWLWINEVPTNIVPVPSVGFVQLSVAVDGHAELISGWHLKPVVVSASEVSAFEQALAATKFAELPEQDTSDFLDYPPEQLMETVVGGRYHFVHRVFGIKEPGIYDAGVMLEKMAERVLSPSERSRIDKGRDK